MEDAGLVEPRGMQGHFECGGDVLGLHRGAQLPGDDVAGEVVGPPRRHPRPKGGRYDTQDFGDDPAGSSMILFAVSTLSYTDTRTIGWSFLITIPAISAASAVAYDCFVCLSTWRKNRPTSGRLLCESTSCPISGAGCSASRSLITRVAIRCSLTGV